MRIKHHRLINRILCILLCTILEAEVLLSGSSVNSIRVYAATDRVLTLDQARALAVANSDALFVLDAKLSTKQTSYAQAVKSIQLKKKDMSTFRYSPLLSFKLPTNPNLSEAYEFTYKPQSIQIEIDEISHSITDAKLEEYRKVNELFTTIVGCQDEIEFTQTRISSMESTVAKNTARLKLGLANKADIDTMQKKITQLSTELNNTERELETAKKKLSDLIDMDVTTGYSFENPFIDAEIPREALDSLVQYTLDNDQSYFEASKTALGSKISLQTYYSLIQGHYRSSDVNIIAPYVNRVLNDDTLSKNDMRAFKAAYERFLTSINDPWKGYYLISLLFFTMIIPKELFKMDLDGDRYVEDSPYSLEEAALQYQEDRISKEKLATELEATVRDNYETYIDLRNAYRSYKDQVSDSVESLKKSQVLNRIGQMAYADYASEQDSLNDLQNDTRKALKDYSDYLYEMDRLTCGGVSAYLSGGSLDTFAVGDGQSNIEADTADGATYHFNSIVEQQMFELTIHLPDDFSTTLTDFELWCDGIMIGDRTPINKALRHLTLTKDDVKDVTIVLYNNGAWVCDCNIEPGTVSGPLDIITGYEVSDVKSDEVGTYSVSMDEELGMVHISFNPNKEEKIAYIRLSTNGKYIDGSDFKDVKKTFNYLGLLTSSLKDVKIEYYDSGKSLLYSGYFDISNNKLKKNVDE